MAILTGIIKDELLTALNKSVKDLQQGIDMHTCLIASILGNEVGQQNFQPLMAEYPSRSREIQLKEVIAEAIDILDESRKSFKSKRLEVLRKKLTQVLIDAK